MEKAGCIKPVVQEAHWLFVKAVTKLKARSRREPVKWVPRAIFRDIYSLRVAWLWETMEALSMAVLSATNLQQVGEAVAPHGLP